MKSRSGGKINVLVAKNIALCNPEAAAALCPLMADAAEVLPLTREGRAIIQAYLRPRERGSRVLLAEVAVLGRPMPVRPKF